jgi:hypothetical protein
MLKLVLGIFENVAQFRYLGMKVTNQNLFQEEIIRGDQSLVMLATIQLRTLVFFSAVSNIKIRMYKTIILPVDLYGCETWSLRLR